VYTLFQKVEKVQKVGELGGELGPGWAGELGGELAEKVHKNDRHRRK